MIDYLLENSIKSIVFWIIGIAAVSAAMLALGMNPYSFPQIDQAKWQAVFLANNQVYFGKLSNVGANYLSLSDVYYLRTATDLDQNQANSNLNLIKLGGEVHGPEDVMYIPKQNVLYWENMKDSSRVVQTINSTRH